MLPNLLTLSRIVIAPVFGYVFISSMESQEPMLKLWISLTLLLCIELSDALDGYLARSMNKVTDFGKFFDPVADSLSRLTVFVSFLTAGLIPLWMFLIFLYRDIFVSGIRYMCIKKGVVVPARISGKLKAIFQAAGSFIVVLYFIMQGLSINLPYEILGRGPVFIIMLFPALFTVWSAIDYWNGNRKTVLG